MEERGGSGKMTGFWRHDNELMRLP